MDRKEQMSDWDKAFDELLKGGLLPEATLEEARELAERYAGPRTWKRGLYANTRYLS